MVTQSIPGLVGLIGLISPRLDWLLIRCMICSFNVQIIGSQNNFKDFSLVNVEIGNIRWQWNSVIPVHTYGWHFWNTVYVEKREILSHQKNISSNQLFSNFFSTVYVEKREILCHQKIISSNQLLIYLLSKTVTFTKFLPKIRKRISVILVFSKKIVFTEFLSKRVRVNLRKFHTVQHSQCGKTRNSLPHNFFSSNQFTVKFFSKTHADLTENLRKQCGSKIPQFPHRGIFLLNKNQSIFTSIHSYILLRFHENFTKMISFYDEIANFGLDLGT